MMTRRGMFTALLGGVSGGVLQSEAQARVPVAEWTAAKARQMFELGYEAGLRHQPTLDERFDAEFAKAKANPTAPCDLNSSEPCVTCALADVEERLKAAVGRAFWRAKDLELAVRMEARGTIAPYGS